MEANITLASELSLEERKFRQETTANKEELALREREVAAKEQELRRSRWLNPTAIGLFAAALGLIGNVIVARVNNQTSQNLEQAKAQSNLILEAIKTGDQDGACRNLVFFVSLGLIDDKNHAISKSCTSVPGGAPVLPTDTGIQPDTGIQVPGNRFTVTMIDGNGRKVQNLRVYSQPRILWITKSRFGVVAFPTLGSPSTMKFVSGDYVIWAAKDGDPSAAMSERKTVRIDSEGILVLRVP